MDTCDFDKVKRPFNRNSDSTCLQSEDGLNEQEGAIGQGFKKLISYLKTMDFASEEAKFSSQSTPSSPKKHKRVTSAASSSLFKMPSGDLGCVKVNKVDLITKQRKSIAEYLNQKRDKEGGNRHRTLSNHVISRWYRPPEIIFIEKQYDQSVDLWSLGCILSDMINCCQPMI